jgi:very-short-patch-repair endonuclease
VLPEPVVHLLRVQRGVVGTKQLRALPTAERRRILEREPELERLTPRVLRHRVVDRSREQHLMAAVLDTGDDAGLWGKSAAALWGFGRFRSATPHVGTPRTLVRSPQLGQVHLLRHLTPEAMTTHLDIPVSRPEETVLWLAGMWTHRWGPNGFDIAVLRTAATLDHAWRSRLIDGHRIHALCERSGGRGRSGIVVFREVLRTRPPDYKPAGSALEERFESSLPTDLRNRLERQVCVGGDDARIGVVDYRHRTRALIVEINGEAVHSPITARAADAERYGDLVAAGFEVMVVWEYDVFHQPRRIVAALREVEAGPFEPRVIRPTRAPWESW